MGAGEERLFFRRRRLVIARLLDGGTGAAGILVGIDDVGDAAEARADRVGFVAAVFAHAVAVGHDLAAVHALAGRAAGFDHPVALALLHPRARTLVAERDHPHQ